MEDKEIKDVRCPNGPQRLFLKLRIEGNQNLVNPELNCMELSCQDCARTLRREGYDIFRVLHRYAINAELIETVVVWENGKETISNGWV